MLLIEPVEATEKGNQRQSSNEIDAWQIGVHQYLATLPPDLKQAFKAPVDAEDCLKLLQQCQSRRKYDRIVSIFEPLIAPLKRFEASIDVLIQTYSSIASPIWGPIRIIIDVASARLTSLHNVMLLIARLVEPLRRFNNYEHLFRENTNLQRAIGALYCDLIEFCARLSAHNTKSPLRRTFSGSFDKDVSEISDKIRHHWTEVDVAANAANLSEAKLARLKEEEQRVLDLKKDINIWLSPSNVQDDLQRLAAICAPGSCDWIMDTAEMGKFTDCKGSSSLRLTALPGGGKSVATAHATQQIQSLHNTVVAYFFCRAVDAEKCFAISVVRTLTWQLLQAQPSLYAEITPLYQRSGRQVADSETLVFEVFNNVVRRLSKTTLYIIIDALDECYDTSSLINALVLAMDDSPANLRLLITSRDDPSLVETLSFCEQKLHLQSNLSPLEDYITNNVQSLSLPLSAPQRHELSQSLQASSKGLWLFAKLMLEDLAMASSVAEIQEQMKTVPDGLAQLYSSILLKQEQQYSKTQMRMTQQVYLWIRAADYVPIDLWRAQGNNGLSDEMLDVIFKYASKSEAELFNPMELISRLCSPLVTTRLLHEDHIILHVFKDEMAHHTAFFAELFHATGETYLQWCQETARSQLPACVATRRIAELQRGACAAWYFNESQHFKQALQRLQERPRTELGDCWLEMACGLWQALSVDRLRRDMTAEEIEEAEELCETLTTFMESDQCLGFLEASIILHYSGQSDMLSNNVQVGLSESNLTPSISRSRPEFFKRFTDVCASFKSDINHCLDRLPATSEVLTGVDTEVTDASDFPSSRRAHKIFTLARRHRWLVLAPRAVSMNGFLLGGKR